MYIDGRTLTAWLLPFLLQVVEIMSSAICDMVEGTYAQLKVYKDQSYSNPPSASTNILSLSQHDSPISKYHSYIQKGIGMPKAALQLLYKVGLRDSDLTVDDYESHSFNDSTKLLEAQFSPLLAKSCRCAAILGGYDSTIQQLASDFATHLSLAEQVRQKILNCIIICTYTIVLWFLLIHETFL